MNQDVHGDDKVMQTDSILTTNIVTTDESGIVNIDPLIQPLIDTNELELNDDNDERLNTLGQKFASILTLHSYRQVETSTSSKRSHRCAGIFYALLGAILFTCSGFTIKQLRVDFFDALLCRFILQTFILIVFVYYKRYKILNGTWNLILLQIVRTTLASGGLFFFYASYRYIPLPDLTTFRYTQVIWTAILATESFSYNVINLSSLFHPSFPFSQ